VDVAPIVGEPVRIEVGFVRQVVFVFSHGCCFRG
jgi:hypothetical protein